MIYSLLMKLPFDDSAETLREKQEIRFEPQDWLGL